MAETPDSNNLSIPREWPFYLRRMCVQGPEPRNQSGQAGDSLLSIKDSRTPGSFLRIHAIQWSGPSLLG